MAKPRDDRQNDLLRPALEPVIELGHPLARLPQRIDWGFLDGRFSRLCTAVAGRPLSPTRLVAGHPPRSHSPRHCWSVGRSHTRSDPAYSDPADGNSEGAVG
jgi:IS5 family transposase